MLESENDEGLQLPVQTNVFSSVVNACRIKESNMTLKMDQLFYMQKSPLNYNLDGNHPDDMWWNLFNIFFIILQVEHFVCGCKH